MFGRGTKVNVILISADAHDTLLTGHDSPTFDDCKPGSQAKRGGTSMKLYTKNPNHCLHCGKQLSIFHLLVDWLYCNSSHKSTHVRQLNELAKARLAAKQRTPSEVPEPCESQLGQAGVVVAS
jgi:hypothetical protein